jgi:hypothetical protein
LVLPRRCRNNRYYDPTTDQFLSVDPDVTTTDKPYVFTNDDSLNVEDPAGLDPIEADPSGGGIDGLDVAFSIDNLKASGEEPDPSDKGGKLTRAGRAFAKAPEVFGSTSGGPEEINRAGQSALERILSNPETKVSIMRGGNFAGGLRFESPDGVSAVYSPSGVFEYFGGQSR